MIKKAALAAVCAVSASFASWDLFPVQEAGKGEAKIVYSNTWLDDVGGYGLVAAGVRYTVVNNLELALYLPYLPYEFDSEGNFHSFADGVGDLTVMARYQFLPNFNGFLDVTFPVGNETVVGYDEAFRFHFGAQYSQKFGMINFGSELGFALETYGNDDVTPPWHLNAAAEADFLVNEMFVPYVGIDFAMELGTYTGKDGNYTRSHTGHFVSMATVGSYINLTPNFSLDVFAAIQTQWNGYDFYEPDYKAGVGISYKF
ncbi:MULTISPECIES: hypothetical protein [unclassified Fibrobacter]|uniref:hypothetical protein n=1 Tax=unclassified Fibrobacter TaxID=2634177 RepID=UPI000D6CCFF4|nr:MULTISPECIES: hypothetical protein [unclassified Fibrobacter]PWJ71709.1 hypothetical protein BGX12_10272 [Fibrobacter sp. UWR4]PZW74066.1 hypothetical protein C8E88_100188 [Fibrobacter sp. UWR1]